MARETIGAGGRQERLFFFEEKNQKTFITWNLRRRAMRRSVVNSK
jgi:hypothetical protein